MWLLSVVAVCGCLSACVCVCVCVGVFVRVARGRSVQNTSITGTLPLSIGSLSALELLGLTNSHMSGTLPSSMARLTNLEVSQSGRQPIECSESTMRTMAVDMFAVVSMVVVRSWWCGGWCWWWQCCC
jgi:hypothetical protein